MGGPGQVTRVSEMMDQTKDDVEKRKSPTWA